MKVNVVRLASAPYVFATQINPRNPFIGDTLAILERLPDEDVLVFIIPAFSIHVKSDENKERRVKEFLAVSEKYPKARLIALCNEPIELEVFKNSSVRAEFVNQNAFLDERKFRVLDGVEKKYRAVYNGQLKDFKRHELARQVDDLALIYYGGAADLPYFEAVQSALPNADYLNGLPQKREGNAFKFLSTEQVCRIYNEARVGLALSGVEGAMYASAEYLLSGLPVVSTKNFGGRDEFADSDFWLTVDADEKVVSDAVAEVLDRDICPHEIRKRTMRKIVFHRRLLYKLVEEYFASCGVYDRDYESEFLSVFVDKIWKQMIPVENIVQG